RCVCCGRRRRGCVRARRGRVGPRLARGAIGAPTPAGAAVMAAAPKNVPSIAGVIAEFRRALDEPARPQSKGVLGLLLDLHHNNVVQWNREDAARRDDADDHAVAAAKRDIDELNTKRHELVEAIDAALVAGIDQAPAAPPTTESPATALDRLSVLVIRISHTERAAS